MKAQDKYSKFDLLSPQPMLFEGVGHVISPTLRSISKSGGETAYNDKLNILLMTKVQILESLAEAVEESVLKELDNFSLFEIIMAIGYFRDCLVNSLRYFLTEDIRVPQDGKTLITFDPMDKRRPSDTPQYGEVTADNYVELRDLILYRNYMTPPAETGKRRSKRMIEFDKKLEQGRKKSKKYKEQRKAMQLGNIVSKVSQRSAGLNIINVYDLTVYQLYNQFFEIGTQVQLDAVTTRWCIWGREKFDFSLWYKTMSDH